MKWISLCAWMAVIGFVTPNFLVHAEDSSTVSTSILSEETDKDDSEKKDELYLEEEEEQDKKEDESATDLLIEDTEDSDKKDDESVSSEEEDKDEKKDEV